MNKLSKIVLAFTLLLSFIGNAAFIKTTHAEVSNDARLTALYLSGVSSLSPGFNADTHVYSVNVPSTQGSVQVTAIPTSSNATVFINGNQVSGNSSYSSTVSLSYGTNTVQISTSIPGTGFSKNYVVMVTRQQTETGNLLGLTLSNVTLDRVFTPEVTTYSGSVSAGTNYVVVTPIVMNDSTVTVNGMTVVSGGNQLVSLSIGTTTITVVVTGPTGISKTYTSYISRSSPSSNAALKSVAVNGQNYAINNTTIIGYVSNGVSGANVSIAAADSTATVKLDGNVVNNSTISVYLDTKQSNRFTITVTASDGITQMSYYLYIIRDASQIPGGGSTGSTENNFDAEFDSINGVITVTEGKGASSVSNRGSNGTKNFTVTLGDTSIIKKLNESTASYTKFIVDYSKMMGLDDKVTVKFSRNLLDVLRTKGIEIQLLSENSSVAVAASRLSSGIYSDSTLTVGRILAKNKYGKEYTPVTSAVGIVGTGAFPGTPSDDGPYTLKMKIAVSTGDNRKSNVYQETAGGWSVVSSQTLDDIKRVMNVSAGNFMIMDYVKHFIDIENHWAYDLIDFMARKQFVDGYSDDRFRPDRYITRSEFTTLLVRVLKDKDFKAIRSEGIFQDVSPSDWYYSNVNEGYKLGLVTGMTSDTFEPSRDITREEMATISVRAMILLKGKPSSITAAEVDSLLSKFTDQNEIGGWARSDLAYAVKDKIMDGVFSNRMEPKSFATRAQATVVLYKILEATENL